MPFFTTLVRKGSAAKLLEGMPSSLSPSPPTPIPITSRTTSTLHSLFRRNNQQMPRQLDANERLEPIAPKPPSPSPETAKLATAFVNALKATQLSDFLAWFLYFDVVELPESPALWYKHIDAMEMRGWIALGVHMSETVNTGYELDLVVLDSICDRLRLRRGVLHEYLIQLSDPETMTWTQLATIIKKAGTARKTEIESLELQKTKIMEILHIAKRIRPTEDSTFQLWRDDIIKRLQGYLAHVIAPRMVHNWSKEPISDDQRSRDRLDGLRLSFLYEAMQHERHAPLIRYGIFPESQRMPTFLDIPDPHARGVPSIHNSFVEKECELERSHSATKLRDENRHLRMLNAELNKELEALRDSNLKLARKVAGLGRVQPALYQKPDWGNRNVVTPIPMCSRGRSQSMIEFPESPESPTVQHARMRIRSMSDSAAKMSALTMDEDAMTTAGALSKSNRTQNAYPTSVDSPGYFDGEPMFRTSGMFTHTPESQVAAAYPTTESLHVPKEIGSHSEDYSDIFGSISEPLTQLPLLHPGTGEPLTPASPCTMFGFSRPQAPPRRISMPAISPLQPSLHTPTIIFPPNSDSSSFSRTNSTKSSSVLARSNTDVKASSSRFGWNTSLSGITTRVRNARNRTDPPIPFSGTASPSPLAAAAKNMFTRKKPANFPQNGNSMDHGDGEKEDYRAEPEPGSSSERPRMRRRSSSSFAKLEEMVKKGFESKEEELGVYVSVNF
ncbi:hypothetical protein P280DRAFT_520948 [Massarina eburnea CBS 473.64]|uniref:Uncharacterized protein n=1 Tax=Massarina eburnea CBS 473.64 TaxID=1395130 RepID=A0A6A6RRS9_9PLEO|nr:hypothetical protein P280DRAFT_520948 [Massarina eburnea CBS 473.64]